MKLLLLRFGKRITTELKSQHQFLSKTSPVTISVGLDSWKSLLFKCLYYKIRIAVGDWM